MWTATQYAGLSLLHAAAAFDVPKAHLVRRWRRQPAVFARQVSMWLMREVLGWSSATIGQVLRRDHGTVLHAWQAVRDRMTTNPDARSRCEQALRGFCADLGRDPISSLP